MARPDVTGPTELLLVRHGESEGNVASRLADEAGALRLDVAHRDADVPLSALGEQQARALGERLAREPAPDAVWVSPYLRARRTAELALGGLPAPGPRVHVDERLRDRELGVLDTLTTAGVAQLFPEEAARRAWLGKFYHRPAGGESWVDVAGRLRTWLADLERTGAGPRVLVVAHDAVVLLVRYVCQELDEAALVDVTRHEQVANTSVTRLVRDAPGEPWVLHGANDTAHLSERGTTDHPGETS